MNHCHVELDETVLPNLNPNPNPNPNSNPPPNPNSNSHPNPNPHPDDKVTALRKAMTDQATRMANAHSDLEDTMKAHRSQ